MVKSIFGLFGDWLGSSDKGPEGPSVRRTTRVRQQGTPDTSEQTGFGSEVDRLLDQGSLAHGRIHFLNLERIRGHFGPRWERMAEHCHGIIEKTLQEYLGRGDFFTRHSEDIYILVFRQLPPDAAKLKVTLIAKRILEKLMGSDARLDLMPIRTAIAPPGQPMTAGNMSFEAVDATQVIAKALEDVENEVPWPDLGPLPELDGGPAWQLLKHDGRSGGPGVASGPGRPSGPGPARPSNPASANERLFAALKRSEGWYAEQEQAVVSRFKEPEPEPEPKPADRPDWKDAKWQAFSVRTLSGKPQAPAAQPERRPSLYDHIDPEFHYYYQPVWNVGTALVTTYICCVGLKVEGRTYAVDALVPDEVRHSVNAQMDRILLRKAICDLGEALAENRRYLVAIPVHYSTLRVMSSWREYLAVCNTIPKDLQQYLVWEIVDAAVGGWHSQTHVAVAAIKQFGRAVNMRLPLDHPHFRDLEAVGIHAVGIDLNDYAARESELFVKLDDYARKAAADRLRTYAYGVKSTSLAEAAIGAGFDYLCGEAIVGQMAAPRGVFPFTKADLFARALRAFTSAASSFAGTADGI